MAETSRAQAVRKIAESWPGITAIHGQTAPRNIKGTATKSEHTFGNALDIYGAKTALSSLGTSLDTQRSTLAIGTLCYDGNPARTFDHCTTPHTDHLHVDFLPHCGGRISDNGTGNQRATACEQFQGSGVTQPGQNQPGGNADPTPGAGIDLLGLGNLGETLERIAARGLWVFLGAMAITAGIVFMVQDTKAFQVAKGAATKAITKGIV